MKKILISGAGIGGLAAAIRLSHNNYDVTVVEKNKLSRTGGYLVALSHQSYIFAEEMGLIPDLKPFDLSIMSSSYHDKKGRNLLALDYGKMMEGLDIIQLMRGDLAHVLYQHAEKRVDIRFGDVITAIEGAQVTFASGKQEEFDIIIGADGVHSGVRAVAFDDKDVTHNYLDLHCAAFRLQNVLGLEKEFQTHMERNRYMAVFNTLDGDLGAVFVWANDARNLPPPEARRDALLQAFAGSGAIIEKVLPHCPEDGPPYMDVLSQIYMPIWHKGRSVLVGDAAHCLTLFSGRGAAAAFAGACRLCNAIIANDTPEAAFRAYEAEMRPIINEIMPATRGAVKWYVPMSAKNHILRDSLMRYVPNSVFRQYFKMKYSNV
jgi:2-polyprenyl-6-methoxyphenol hydroxylase-like FAD-dependent oxidoreductase